MTTQTQRWMKRELQQLLAQRARYAQAEAASTDVRQKVSHTTQRLRLDQEIQGREEALAALARHDEGPRLRRDRGLRRRQPMFTIPAPQRSASPLGPLTVGVCLSTFALGFVLVGGLLDAPRSSTTARPSVQRYQRLAPTDPVRVQKRSDDPVMAAIAPTARRHR